MRDVVNATLFHIFCSECKENTTVMVATNLMMHVQTFVQLYINIEGHVKAYKN